jgi:plastocyanin
LPSPTSSDSFQAIFFNYVIDLGDFLPPPTCEVAMLKSVFRFWPMCLVILVASLLCSCGTVHSVGVFGSIEALDFVPDPVTVQPGDFIEWEHSFSGTVTVQLDSVPVTPTMLEIPEGASGRVVVNLDARPGKYKYIVTLVMGNDTITVDPHIIVEEDRRRPPGG